MKRKKEVEGKMSSESWNSHQRKAKAGHCRYQRFAMGVSHLTFEPLFENEGHAATQVFYR